MKKLQLPVIKESPLPGRPLSMDDYVKFVMFMKHAFGKRAEKKDNRPIPVDVPFYL